MSASPKYLIAAHPIQRALLSEVAGKGVDDLSLREMAKRIGSDASPQKIKHHLGQMVKYGFLDIIGGRYRVSRLLEKRS
jgi:predicted transcriptional regulator